MDLLQLQSRHQTLTRELMALEAREEEKARQRAELTDNLRSAGVDPDCPEEEMNRLEAESNAALQASEQLLNEFEEKLKAAKSGVSG